MKNENKIQIMPNTLFWEAIFSSFIILKNFKNYFTDTKLKLKSIEEKPLFKLFYELIHEEKNTQNAILDFQQLLISKNQQDLLINPVKILYFILNELHNELKSEDNYSNQNEINNNNILNNVIGNREIDEAFRIFTENNKNNKSFIQELFFGIKKISLKCESCDSVSYKFTYLKFCPLNIQSIEGFIELEDLYNNIQREFFENYFCTKCNKEQQFKIKIDIHSEPEILIFFIFNHTKNVKIDFSLHLNDIYELKSFVMDEDNTSILDYLLCCKKNKNNRNYNVFGRNEKKLYKYIKNEENLNFNNDELNKGNPYILFYQKSIEINKDEYIKKLDKISDISNYTISSRDTLNSRKNKKDNFFFKSFNIITASIKDKKKYPAEENITNNENISKSSIDLMINEGKDKNKNKIKDNNNNIILNNNDNNNNLHQFKNIKKEKKNLISSSTIKKSTIKSINKIGESIKSSSNSNYSEEDGLIRLYFKCGDGNVLFIDVDKNLTFENIIVELKNQYDWINIDDNHLYFNDNKINKNEIPKNLGIKNGDYIDFNINLID